MKIYNLNDSNQKVKMCVECPSYLNHKHTPVPQCRETMNDVAPLTLPEDCPLPDLATSQVHKFREYLLENISDIAQITSNYEKERNAIAENLAKDSGSVALLETLCDFNAYIEAESINYSNFKMILEELETMFYFEK